MPWEENRHLRMRPSFFWEVRTCYPRTLLSIYHFNYNFCQKVFFSKSFFTYPINHSLPLLSLSHPLCYPSLLIPSVLPLSSSLLFALSLHSLCPPSLFFPLSSLSPHSLCPSSLFIPSVRPLSSFPLLFLSPHSLCSPSLFIPTVTQAPKRLSLECRGFSYLLIRLWRTRRSPRCVYTYVHYPDRESTMRTQRKKRRME